MNSSNIMKLRSTVLAMACGATLWGSLALADELDRKVAFDIDSQPLEQALVAFSQQAGIQIVLNTGSVGGATVPALKATVSSREALRELLSGSPFSYSPIGERTVSVTRVQAGSDEQVASSTQDTAPSLEPLAEVTVTATRPTLFSSQVVTSGVLGDKDPLDIPFSVASYSSELAKLQNAHTPAEILKNDPSVQNSGFYVYQNHIIIRGIQARAGGVRRDGLHANDEGDLPMEAFDRLEVVKGAAGFLYGFAEPGGIQNWVTKRPTRDTFVSLETQLRSGSGRYVHVDAGGPVGDGRFGYRANVAYEDQGDFSHRGDTERAMGSLALDAKLTDDLLVRLDASHQSREFTSQLGLPLTTAGTEPPEYDPRVSFAPSWLRAKFVSSSVALRFEYQLPADWKVLGQVAHDWSRFDPAYGYMTTLTPTGDVEGELYGNPLPFYTRNRWTNGQVLLLGKLDTGPVQHDVVVGMMKRDGTYSEYYPTSEYPMMTFTGNLFTGFNFPQRPTDSYSYARGYVFEGPETHVYAADTLSLGERWQVLAGVRHVDVADFYGGKVQKTSPSGAITFKAAENTRIYGSYARSLQQGYRGPCQDRPDVSNGCDIAPPIEAKQYEVGVKTRLGGNLDLSVAAFRIELPFDYVDENRLIYGRFGNQVNQGVEVLASGNVLSNLAVVLGAGYLNAELARNEDPTLNGNRVPGIPQWNANAFVNYGVTAIPGLSLTGGAYWGASRQLDVRNSISVDGYTRVDLGAQYRIDGILNGVTLRANVNNVLDEFYWEGLNFESFSAALGRTYSVTAEFKLR
ncbi:TonB-dependent siderophore receptor [Steroidobacter sp.]|uniref:TonB-dependent siderophore receptor n=1 Tax=Steroidobacter sp. TaxID=1978227 RepID=UPI001A3CF04F|nr:TonB-dependent receptor [Steroidobacter sp.]MBL8270061.1 TonB-dependent receptor [Steroidobacter sp.]